MENRNNISNNSELRHGYTLTRASYDARQEINSKVIGVLKYNNEIRKKLLNRNIGKYNQINLDEGIGYISNFYSLESSKPFYLGLDGLLGYTHITKSDYQHAINKKYNFGDYIEYYQNNSNQDINYSKWNGLYKDYTDYISEIFGYNKFSFIGVRSILNDFLKYDNIKYAMEETRIGTINPNPLTALSGVITTNVSNFSGKDTPLGTITNYLYAKSLKDSAYFNSLRKTPYITPEVYEFIGNKLSTLSVISSDFRIDDETGRLSYDFGDGIGVENYENLTLEQFQDLNMIDGTKNIPNSKNARYLNLMKKSYLPFEDLRYSFIKKSRTLNGTTYPALFFKTHEIWNEGDNISHNNYIFSSYYNNGFSNLTESETDNDLLEKTRQLFTLHDENGIDTLVGRFHTSGGRDKTHNEVSLMQTAVTQYGLSKGRNLLTKIAYQGKNDVKINGYDNPYCRVWTYHHQYSKINDLIRPFSNEKNGKTSISDVDLLQSDWWM